MVLKVSDVMYCNPGWANSVRKINANKPATIKTMIEDKGALVRRCRDGYEFFKSLRRHKEDLAAARTAASTAAAARV